MKTLFKSSLIILIIFSFTSLSFAAGDTVSREEFMKALQKIEDLTKEVQTLKGKEQTRQDTDIGILAEDVAELSELFETVEKKSVLDSINMTGELRTRVDWFHFRNGTDNEEISALFSNRFRLNLKANVSKNLTFHARLVMYRNWNGGSEEDDSWYNHSRTRGEGTELEVERVYADYYFTLIDKLPMALTFGRLPISDGQPTELRENTARKSTYPGLAFDGEADGIALSTDLSQVTGLKNSALRFVYARSSETGDSLWRKPTVEYDVTDILALQFETQVPKLANSLFVINLLYVPEVVAIDPEREFMGAPIVPIGSPSKDLGSLYKLTFYLQANRFLDSWFDLFAGYSYLRTDAKAPNAWGIEGTTLAYIGLFNDDAGISDRSANCYYFGGRVNLPIASLNNPKIGIEFNRGSKYWVGLNFGAEDPLHKLDIRGKVWDFYYIQPVTKNFMIRVGHTLADVAHDNSAQYYGLPASSDDKIKNTYILLDAKF